MQGQHWFDLTRPISSAMVYEHFFCAFVSGSITQKIEEIIWKTRIESTVRFADEHSAQLYNNRMAKLNNNSIQYQKIWYFELLS